MDKIFNRFKQDNKYFDLKLIIGTQEFLCHKAIVCSKSDLINMLITKEQEKIGPWPPINTLQLNIPDGLTSDDIITTINSFYNTNNKCCIKTLLYLAVPIPVLDNYLNLRLYGSSLLTQDQIDLLIFLYDNFRGEYLNPYIQYYYLELSDRITVDDGLYFGKTLIHHPKYLKLNKTSSEQKIIHFPSTETGPILPNKKVTFTAFGIKFDLHRFIKSYGYNDHDDMIKLYVNSDNNTPIMTGSKSLRTTFAIYAKNDEPYIKISEVDDFVPDHYKTYYMVENYKNNKLYIDVPDRNIGSDHIRLSLLIEIL
jgi:hypothetical protein